MRKVHQLTATEQRQQGAEQDADHQIDAGPPSRAAADLGIALPPQLAFAVDEGIELTAHAVGEVLAAPAPNLGQVIAAVTAAAYDLLGEQIPLLLQRQQAFEPLHLWRVVADHVDELLGQRTILAARLLVGREVVFLAAEQEAAHAGFQVQGQLVHLAGSIEHLVGVLDPADHIEQVADQQREEQRADQPQAERQPDVTVENPAKPFFVHCGLIRHWDVHSMIVSLVLVCPGKAYGTLTAHRLRSLPNIRAFCALKQRAP